MIARRLTSTNHASLCALASLLALGGLLLCSAPALAVRGHVFSSSFGSPGSGNGQLSAPSALAVNESSGSVYLLDTGNNRVEYFSATGSYEGQFDGSGSNVLVEAAAAPTGKFSQPTSIAVDNDPGSPSFGDVYVGDAGHAAIDKFSATGEYIGQITETPAGGFGEIEGLAVDASGTLWLWQGSEERAINSFTSALANEFIASHPVHLARGPRPGLAVDSNANLYVAIGGPQIAKLDSSGRRLKEHFDSLVEAEDQAQAVGVAVDVPSNDVYISDAAGTGSVARFSSSGSLLEEFGATGLTELSSIAVNSSSNRVYVADASTDKVDVFVLEPESHPAIEREDRSLVSATSATLGAQIKPAGPDTTYYFQYGAASCASSPSACTELPAAPGRDIGGGFEPQSVSVHLQGLTPGVVYHYRVIATNALGSAEGADQTFTTQQQGAEFRLSDGRAWEMVTPADKHGARPIAIGAEWGTDIQAAADGSAITFPATSPFVANPAGNRSPENAQVLSSRESPGSWQSVDLSTPNDPSVTELQVGRISEYKLFAPDLSLGLLEPPGGMPLSPKQSPEETQEQTLYLRQAGGEYLPLVTKANVAPGTAFGESAATLKFSAASPDLRHVVFQSRVRLTETPTLENGGGLYEWTAGRLQLVSVLPGTRGPASATLGNHDDNVRHAVSDDGTRVIWQDLNSSSPRLYLRDTSRQETVQIDAAQGAPEPTSFVKTIYNTASSDGSRVFFTSPQRLTADSTAVAEGQNEKADLYEFEVTSPKDQPLAGRLTDLSADRNAGESADVRGVIGASEDGSAVYFVANGVLGDGAQHAARNGACEHATEVARATCSLYVAHYDQATQSWGEPVFIAALSGADHPSWGDGPESRQLRTMSSRVSPSGQYLAFMSQRSLTGYENRDINSGLPDEEVFQYNARSRRLVCASCNPTGARPRGIFKTEAYEERLVSYTKSLWIDRWLAGSVPAWSPKDLNSAVYQSRYLSDAGRLFFNSSDALVPADGNGAEDVYEFEPAGVGSCQPPGYGQSASDVFSAEMGGCVALISAGSSGEESAFMDASESGGDVFFLTLSQLSARDRDTSLDLYDAHECVAAVPCAPGVASVPAPCSTGDACRPAATPQPAIFGAPASATFSGAGNIGAAPPRQVGVKSLSRAQKLARALRACRKKPARKRLTCERQARKSYRAKRASSSSSQVRKSLSAKAGH
ncbi:MAG TPA: hypothetical protein VGG98_05645 [Solirubrobacteraceae bacterium]|jgi:DNA-binding beta-propeller fold protein YncE